VIDSAIAMFRDKGSLAGEITTLKATNGKLTADLAATHAQLATVTAERDNLQAGFSRLEAALAEAAKEKTTLQTEVTHQLASAGVPETALPKPVTTASSAETVEELRKQLESPTLTAQQRGDLVARIRKINAAN
jgi:chromosome segregation ATPase